ncbi:MAG: type II toxin-antitoxin system RelE/ParE family toxin [Bacteroidia bacterium]
MAYKVIWSPKAEKTFDIVIDYLQKNWTEKQIKTFIIETQRVLRMLAKNPYMFRGSEKENIHEILVSNIIYCCIK